MPPPARYNTGYNVGVGGAVVHEGRLLLVRRASRRGRGNWQVPGGFIEPDETIEQAVVREVEEEAGVTAAVEGVLGLRNRYDLDSGNSLYIVLLLRPLSGEPKPDGKEVDRAEYFSMAEIRALEQVPSINLEIAQRALSTDRRLLMPSVLTHQASGLPYMLFVG
ncbi:MAG: NUDIX domain-containing protein [Candidatus Tectomicrobia bacterium]|uniref:NUDIX domain-containing protein n=1 Tax=Tectimicrobiota bacterium TaxID=2528274 RepID=A0A937VX16_UNCTE|nr:NUDIX domain-containing protein [Candidatus Tectomicrobia bacterium]